MSLVAGGMMNGGGKGERMESYLYDLAAPTNKLNKCNAVIAMNEVQIFCADQNQ